LQKINYLKRKMNQAIAKTINLQEILSQAKQQTLQMSEQKIDISDPSIVTPLEWAANQYPEIAQECNQILKEEVIKYIQKLAQQ